MDPTQGNPVLLPGPSAYLISAQEMRAEIVTQEASAAEASIEATTVAVETTATAEVIPPQSTSWPIGLVDFNKPIIVMDEYREDVISDNPQILTVLKGSMYPVVVSYWHDGEQKIGQFDTDGAMLDGDLTIENDEPYPRTIFVLVRHEGRKLTVDEQAYVSAEAARSEASEDEIAGIFPLVIEAPKPVIVGTHADAVIVDEASDEGVEDEDDGDDVAGTVVSASQPTELYVAGRMRRVGDTVRAYRKGEGTRECVITKLDRDHKRSLCIKPADGKAYWALNKNIQY
jgi:hypothetical protein